MFKRLFCKHKYKYYNTRIQYQCFGNYGYNVFQFVCTKCGKETEVSQLDIDNAIQKTKSIYNKAVALGEEPIKSSRFCIPRHMDINICYDSPAATLVLKEYSKYGIDLKELND